ncbi:MAG TPA: flavin reductase family protein [Burkholderiaceae bacterium]|nr:flavin reductase family protein [Burkholderiaceae bacterium]
MLTSHAPDYRNALAQFATGVTVVTTRDAHGKPVGLTVNSFNSVSLEPPLVLWCLALKSGSLHAFEYCTHYVVNMLAGDQLEVARRFATRDTDRFGPADWRDVGGLPVLEGCVATLRVRNRSRHPEGDHVILVGEVEDFAAPGGSPLVFHDGRYFASAVEAPLPPALRTPWR